MDNPWNVDSSYLLKLEANRRKNSLGNKQTQAEMDSEQAKFRADSQAIIERQDNANDLRRGNYIERMVEAQKNILGSTIPSATSPNTPSPVNLSSGGVIYIKD